MWARATFDWVSLLGGIIDPEFKNWLRTTGSRLGCPGVPQGHDQLLSGPKRAGFFFKKDENSEFRFWIVFFWFVPRFVAFFHKWCCEGERHSLLFIEVFLFTFGVRADVIAFNAILLTRNVPVHRDVAGRHCPFIRAQHSWFTNFCVFFSIKP